MSQPIIECVPNFSEGIHTERILAIVREMASLLMIGLRRPYPKAQPLGDQLIEGTRLTAALSGLLLRHVSTIVKAR